MITIQYKEIQDTGGIRIEIKYNNIILPLCMLGLFEDDSSSFMPLPQVSGDDSIPVEPSQDQSPISSMENVPPQVHSQDAPVEGMTVTPDIPVCTQFYANTCGCDKAHGNPCSTLFTLDYIIDMRAQCSLLSHDELDLVLMGFIASAMLDSDGIRDGRHQNTAKRRRVTMSFKHHGLDVCKKTFLFLHGIGNDRFKALRKHYKEEGLQVRQHGNSKRTPHHAMPFAAIRNVVSFLHNYAEENAILLPGRIPAYKRDDIKLLPSSCSKMVR